MKIQHIAPGCAEHLKFLSRVFIEPSRGASVFTSAYRKLLAHRYNLMIPADARVLEIGCGAGHLLHLIHAKDKVGIDLSPEQVDRAKARYPLLDVRLANGETGPLPEGLFDVIVISDTLNYAADVEVMLRASPRVLARWHPSDYQYLQHALASAAWGGAVPRAGCPATGEQLAVAAGRHQSLRARGLGGVQKSFGKILLPAPLGPVSTFFNRWAAPLAEWACLATLSDRSQTRPAAARTETRIGRDPCTQRGRQHSQCDRAHATTRRGDRTHLR